jgi:hypothetical protein
LYSARWVAGTERSPRQDLGRSRHRGHIAWRESVGSRSSRPVGGRNSIVVEMWSLLRVRRFLTREDFHQQKTCDRDGSSSCAYLWVAKTP